MSETAYVARTMIAPRSAPVRTTGVLGFIRTRLLNSPTNILLTIACILLLWFTIIPTVRFLLVDAVWQGSDRNACLPETVGRPVGACWPFIQAKLSQFIYGFYPEAERWRVDLTFFIGIVLLLPLLIPRAPAKGINAALFFFVFPIVAFFLLHGGYGGLDIVPTRLWGGMLVTLVVAITGIVASMPIGIALALGRRSSIPLIRFGSIAFIEFWRGVPLITVLFFATYMLPLFLPGNFSVDGLVRVLIGVALFAGAYNAEVIRGGLNAVPRGQAEAANALGLSWWKTTRLVVLPQALRHVIPGLVNSFIALLKDTSLVSIVALFDLLGQLRAAFADPAWSSPTTLFTGFAFTGIIYFVLCFGMSRYSLFVERRLNAHRRS
ncbi:amino acid ABC transporter permease [Rhodopseudomonas boonkerdii]|uniref:amino acid ABC transporter permease n=1 Tax=Rhodopseudomonas boonkerdii TaxID=475937 RepID=UPI001E4C491C|nr:amino acid ABC transporter permease [Rhodopseudomonas boonkerdii]UGV26642.1 amino acid ABC transporter permease [Rhodopseudomonas boonkerdii]